MEKSFRSPAVTRGSTLITYLSLFVLLLVFFVVLGANSQWRPHRAKAVLRGVERQFGPGGVPAAVAEGRLSEADWQAARARLTALGDLIGREFQVAKVTVEGQGLLHFVELPVDGLFVPGSAVVRPERLGLLHRIARVLSDPPPGVRYLASAMLALSGPVRGGPGSVDRVASLGEALTLGGAPVDALAVGLEAGRPDMVRFLFEIDVVEPTTEHP